MTRVSIVTPAHNARSFIHNAAKSVLSQTLSDWEMIIASDDGEDYLAGLEAQGIKDHRIRQVSTGREGTGPAHARNCALAVAKGRIIAALDADDTLHPEALERLVPKAIEHGAAYSNLNFVSFETGKVLQNYNRVLKAGLKSIEEVLTSCVHTYVWVLFDRERVPTARWNEAFPMCNDMYLYAYLTDILGGMYYTPRPLYTYYRRDGSMCNIPKTLEQSIRDFEQMYELIKDPKKTPLTMGGSRIFTQYLSRWLFLEDTFKEALESGKYNDFQDFLRDHCEILYSL